MNQAVPIPEALYTDIASYAAQHGSQVETLVASWLADAIARARDAAAAADEEYDPANDPLMRLAGSIASGDPTLADRHDDYLAEAYEDTHEQ